MNCGAWPWNSSSINALENEEAYIITNVIYVGVFTSHIYTPLEKHIEKHTNTSNFLSIEIFSMAAIRGVNNTET